MKEEPDPITLASSINIVLGIIFAPIFGTIIFAIDSGIEFILFRVDGTDVQIDSIISMLQLLYIILIFCGLPYMIVYTRHFSQNVFVTMLGGAVIPFLIAWILWGEPKIAFSYRASILGALTALSFHLFSSGIAIKQIKAIFIKSHHK